MRRRTNTEVLVDLDLGPVERKVGVTHIGDVDLDEGQMLTEGSPVALRDEGGHPYRATVNRIEPGKYGNDYRLTFQPPPGGADRA